MSIQHVYKALTVLVTVALAVLGAEYFSPFGEEVASAQSSASPPTGLTLVLEDDGDLRLDYTASDLGTHYFELHRSSTESGTYTKHTFRNDNPSPVTWSTTQEGYFYKARGKSCPQRHAVGCDDTDYPWSSWSNVV